LPLRDKFQCGRIDAIALIRGGAHRDIPAMATTLKQHLLQNLGKLQGYTTEELVKRRYQKFMAYGV